MAYLSVGLKFTVTCANCEEPLPVNKAAEKILCNHCGQETHTPAVLWERLVTPQLVQAVGMEADTSTWARGLLAGLGGYSMEYGPLVPRCEGGCGATWPLDDIVQIAEKGDRRLVCQGCGRIHSIRPIPGFFDSVIPFARYVVAEESPEAEGKLDGAGEGVGMRCYHCGAPLSLLGEDRRVHCPYCANDLLIPDDIWQRLHPVSAAHFWYILFDMQDHVGLLPSDVDETLDLEALPGGDTIVLWEEDCTGHLGRSDRTGGLVWHRGGFEIADDARLLYDRQRDIIWALDRDEHRVYCFDAASGKMVRSITHETEDEDLITARENEGVALCTDGSIVIVRKWGEEANTPVELIVSAGKVVYPPDYVRLYPSLRRFDAEGRRIPLWHGSRDESSGTAQNIDFDKLADRTAAIPEEACLMAGPGGTLCVLDRGNGRIARFDPSGRLLGILKPECPGLQRIRDCGVADDGRVFILFDHKKKINHESYSHVGCISPDGDFEILAGPHSSKNAFPLGIELERMAVAPCGEMHLIGSDFDSFRVLGPDGALLWKSPGAVSEDERLAGRLAGDD